MAPFSLAANITFLQSQSSVLQKLSTLPISYFPSFRCLLNTLQSSFASTLSIVTALVKVTIDLHIV